MRFEVGISSSCLCGETLPPWASSFEEEFSKYPHIRYVECWSYVGPRYVGAGLVCAYARASDAMMSIEFCKDELTVVAAGALGSKVEQAMFGGASEYLSVLLDSFASPPAKLQSSAAVPTYVGVLSYQSASNPRAVHAMARGLRTYIDCGLDDVKQYFELVPWLKDIE
jgi:hypothetical protein